MTKLFRLALFCAGIGLALGSSSCSSEYDAYPMVPGKDTIRNAFLGELTAVVSGVQFIADTKYYTDNTTDNIRSISVSGVMFSEDKKVGYNQTISFSIYNYEGPNTYLVGEGAVGTYTLQEEGKNYTYSAVASEESFVTITSDGSNIEGSFRFVLPVTDTVPGNDSIPGGGVISISNGRFSIPR